MKLKLKTVTVTLPTGETAEYSTKDMLAHIVRNGREFGQSREASKVAQGIRILAALDSGASGLSADLDPVDAEAIKAVVASPSCGWSAYPLTQTAVVGINPDGSERKRTATRMIALSAIDLYPLIDGVLTS